MKEKILKKGFLNRLLASLTAISIIFMGLPGTTAMASGSEWTDAVSCICGLYQIELFMTGLSVYNNQDRHADTCPIYNCSEEANVLGDEWRVGHNNYYSLSTHESGVLTCNCGIGGSVKAFFCDRTSTAKADHGGGNEDLENCKYCYKSFTASCYCSSLSSQNGQAATCTEAGWKAYFKCVNEDCGKIYATEYNGGTSYADLNAWKASDEGKIDARGHEWRYNASGATLTATCNRGASHTATLTLTATSPNYSGISGLSAFNDATGLVVNTSDVKFYTVTTEGATTGGTGETSTAPTADGYYYASLTVLGQTAVKAFTIGNPGGGSKPDPKPTPSKSETAAAPTIPTDYVAERVAEEEAMEVSPVTIDVTQYSKNEETVVPGTSYNLSKFITTKGIVKGIKTAVAAANKDKKDTIEIYTGKPFCFNKEIIKTIQESKKTVVYYFHYKGHIYSVTVPATVDASKVLEKAGFAGPLYVGKQLGTTKLVK